MTQNSKYGGKHVQALLASDVWKACKSSDTAKKEAMRAVKNSDVWKAYEKARNKDDQSTKGEINDSRS